MYNFSDKEWGLVLAGGGGKGAYQAGVFKALEESGISDYVTAVAGASVGALNLVLFAAGNAELARQIWGDISPEQFLDIEPDMIDMQEGFVSRDGLLKIIDDYVNLDIVRNCDRRLYVSATEYDELGQGDGKVKYFSLNYRTVEEIKNILLASSALPVIYSPVEIEGKMYRDGGIRDNMPIRPLYIEGIRNFIVVGLSTESKINYDLYPDAKFLFIKPRKSIGDFWDGTLDFTSRGARIRMEIGYMDAIREIEFYDRDDFEAHEKYKMQEMTDYQKIGYKYRQMTLEERVGGHMSDINRLMDKYK